MNETIGRNLKELRSKHDKTQIQVANYLESTLNMYQKLEKGDSQITLTKLIKLCKYYRVSPNYILKGAY